jgi:hypothetical protein
MSVFKYKPLISVYFNEIETNIKLMNMIINN